MQGQILCALTGSLGPRDASGLDRSQFNLQGTCEARDDVVLHLQEIDPVGVELIGPEVRAGLDVDELRAHSHPAAAMMLAARQHITYAKLLADLPHVSCLALVCRGRATSDHECVAN